MLMRLSKHSKPFFSNLLLVRFTGAQGNSDYDCACRVIEYANTQVTQLTSRMFLTWNGAR
jgi:hypothetical protein